MKTIFVVLFSIIFLGSCMDKGKIMVQSKIHNAKLENISFGDRSINYSLLPGEITDDIVIEDYQDKFPKINQLEFYMESNGNKVYLKTKNKYRLDSGDRLVIIISDSTEVINPLLQ